MTVKRKVTEIFRALYVDETYGKDTVLLYYLNIIPLGAGCEGVGAAAEKYFGKSVSELSLAECASLIGITNNPSQYGPYSLARVANSEGEMWTAVQWNKYRQELILHEMLDQGYITQEEHDQAVAEELHFVGVNADETGDDSTETGEIYSWYEEAVISDVWDALKEEYGYSDAVVDLMLSKGGLRIYTCIDPDVQAQAEAIYEDESNLNYHSSSGQRLQSAITIIDNETGDVAAIVGRIGAKELNRGFNLATSAQRQPGSSIKPLTVYAPAVDMGLISPITVIPDYPYQVLGGSAWPVNVDGRYRGQVTVNAAVEDSFNTVAVRVLADLVTPSKGFEYGTQRFHLPLISEQTINGQTVSDIAIAPLSLGGLSLGVSTRDMATAFATFPNDGVYREARTFTRVEDADGNVILDNTREEEQAIKDTTAYYMNYMLTNVVSSGGGYEARISGMTVAGKTGTTDTKDNRWFVGYTPYYTAAVWVGYETPARVQASGNPAAQMFQKVMAPIHCRSGEPEFHPAQRPDPGVLLPGLRRRGHHRLPERSPGQPGGHRIRVCRGPAHHRMYLPLPGGGLQLHGPGVRGRPGSGRQRGVHRLLSPGRPQLSRGQHPHLQLSEPGPGERGRRGGRGQPVFLLRLCGGGRHRAVHRPRRGRPDHRPRRPQWGGGPQRRPRRFRG